MTFSEVFRLFEHLLGLSLRFLNWFFFTILAAHWASGNFAWCLKLLSFLRHFLKSGSFEKFNNMFGQLFILYHNNPMLLSNSLRLVCLFNFSLMCAFLMHPVFSSYDVQFCLLWIFLLFMNERMRIWEIFMLKKKRHFVNLSSFIQKKKKNLPA